MNKRNRMFFRMIIASLVRRRSRMIIALLSIIVGATILSGLGMIYYDVPRQMSSQFRSYGANIIFTSTTDQGISDDSVKNGVEVFDKNELEGYTPYRYENTKIHNLPVTLAGITFDTVMKTSPYWLVDGDMPTKSGETLVGKQMAESLGLSVGDTISAENSFEVTDDTDMTNIPDYEVYDDPETGTKYCDHMLDLKVTGILETGGSEEKYIYVSLDDIEYLTLTDRGYDIVEVSVAASSEKLQTGVDKITNNSDDMTAKLVKRMTESETSVLSKLQSLVFIVTVVVLILTMICVGTTMTAVIAERRQEIGLRKALGAPNSSIILEFLSEGLMFGGIGGIIGSILGYYFAQAVSEQVFASAITFRPLLVPITIVASVLVTGISCLFPIRSTVNVDPALVLKGE